eukprot:s2024_g3.t2
MYSHCGARGRVTVSTALAAGVVGIWIMVDVQKGSAILRPARTRGPSGGQREKNGSKRSASEGGEAYGLDRRCVESALC